MSDAVPNVRFSTDTVNPRFRREVWIESLKPLYDVSPLEKNNSNFNAASQVWEAGGLLFGAITHDAQIMDRRQCKHNRSMQNDYLLMLIYRDGSAKSIHDGKPTEHRPNDVHLLDFSCDHRSVTLKSRVEWVLAPYEKVGFDPDKHASNTIFAANTTTGWVLSELSAMIFQKLPLSTRKDAETMAKMMANAIQSLISGTADDISKRQAARARSAAMRHFVVENIHDLSLDVTTLCQKFEVSRATVFRDFEPGGLQNFMMRHRLDRALDDIASGPSIRGRIALIAEKWGFSSPAHFSRTFRENYGFSPSDAVGVGRSTGLISPHEIGVDYNWTRWTAKKTTKSNKAA
ncbi:MAG: AraC family transcriptional regulator [Pseudomonadota bacterium]